MDRLKKGAGIFPVPFFKVEVVYSKALCFIVNF